MSARHGNCSRGTPLDLSQLPKFENTRGRFIRVSDLTEFRGWVVGERNLKFVIQLDGEQPIEAGQELVGEVFLHEWSLKLRARVLHVSQHAGPEPMTLVGIELLNVNAQHGSGRERFRVKEMRATIHSGAERLAGDCEVLDISLDGLGLVMPVEPRSGTVLDIQLEHEGTAFRFRCEVRYARPSEGGVRCGMLIQHADRIEEQKWKKFLGALNERTSIAA